MPLSVSPAASPLLAVPAPRSTVTAVVEAAKLAVLDPLAAGQDVAAAQADQRVVAVAAVQVAGLEPPRERLIGGEADDGVDHLEAVEVVGGEPARV